MKLRLHLVRFMYINLILSCCFWLYDNAAAADVLSPDAATPAETAADQAQQIPLAAVSSPESYIDRNFKKLKKVTAAHPPPPPAAVIATTRTTDQEADSAAFNLLTAAPRTSAKTKMTDVEEDTSVETKVLPCSVNNINNNNNNEYINVFPNHNHDNCEVPKNQFNNDEPNSNQANRVVDPAKPKTEEEQAETKQSIPEIISELPGITVTELPLELDSFKDNVEATIVHEAPNGSNNKSVKEQQKESFEDAKEAVQKDETMNDPGGGGAAGSELEAAPTPPHDEGNVTTTSNIELEGATTTAGNATATDEIPMPVFSEWAQKQMEAEASREQAMELEQQVVNNSAQRRNATGSGSGKVPSLKLRSKNYASPDCGAKIIASNGDATNTGAVLSHSSDEYMLSTCGNRIWFVVELCEAVQAQKVELANFELFSSSPKNFTVAVSKRFPTRDWSNVGRFTAEDKRTVQTFELYPHLFGKFVRVDIHSHYSKEHFCPISLFRVFGTSEYEAFETEIRHSDELDDFDDDDAEQTQKQPLGGGSGGGANIFQSASDAVIQMVKKAAQVLVKPTKALRWSSDSLLCRTPATGVYSCPQCNKTSVERINNLLSCQPQQLQLLLVSLPQLRAQILQTRVCQTDYAISLGLAKLDAAGHATTSGMDKRQSFFLSILPAEHVAAMCKLLQAEYSNALNNSVESIEQQININSVLDQPVENVTAPVLTPVEAHTPEAMPELPSDSPSSSSSPPVSATASLEKPPAKIPLTTELPELEIHLDAQTKHAATTNNNNAPPTPPTPADVNIFNVPSDTQEMPTPDTTATTTATGSTLPDNSASPTAATPAQAVELEGETATPSSSASSAPATAAAGDAAGNGELAVDTANGLDDSHLANWESIDSLLTTTVASITAGGGAAAAAAAVVNGNANLGTASAPPGGINLQAKLTHSAQSESVFIRLSNRIKALERNMSLSGQYLEELSRRYKKQVEELQQTLTQQMLTVRTLEDQSRRYMEQEQLYKQQSAELAGEMRSLTYQVQACILVIIIVGTCIFLMLVVGTVYYRKLRRQTQQLRPQLTPSGNKHCLARRKSYEQIVDHSLVDKKRRPSEEAMLILNGCGDIPLVEQTPQQGKSSGSTTRRRKISVCYGSNNNIALNMFNARTSLLRHRKGNHKHTSLDSAQVPSKQLDMFFDVDTMKTTKPKKKSQQELKRQKSAPENSSYTNGEGNQTGEAENTQSDFDESLILDDDDLANFIPNSDLAYNEFMPDGPSGYQIVGTSTVNGKTQTEKSSQTAKKSRRVSSPAFFKSPFGKNKNKGGNFNGVGGLGSSGKNFQSPHEATSWEWCRLKRTTGDKQSKETSLRSAVADGGAQDNLSLSEINFPTTNSNSFRILGEAIFSANDSKLHANKSIAAGNNSSNCSSGSSGASTTSSTTKKKQRPFNSIFRKVF